MSTDELSSITLLPTQEVDSNEVCRSSRSVQVRSQSTSTEPVEVYNFGWSLARYRAD